MPWYGLLSIELIVGKYFRQPLCGFSKFLNRQVVLDMVGQAILKLRLNNFFHIFIPLEDLPFGPLPNCPWDLHRVMEDLGVGHQSKGKHFSSESTFTSLDLAICLVTLVFQSSLVLFWRRSQATQSRGCQYAVQWRQVSSQSLDEGHHGHAAKQSRSPESRRVRDRQIDSFRGWKIRDLMCQCNCQCYSILLFRWC